MTERLPDIGEETWGTILGARDTGGGFLRVEHNDDGTHKVSGGFLNVKDYGAVGDGVTDDTAAFRTVAALAAAGSAKIRIPRGIYIVDTTAGAIFTVGTTVALSLEGDGAGNVGTPTQINQVHGTRIARVAGTNPILQATGTAANARSHGKVVGIEFNGGNLNGPAVQITKGNEWLFDDVRVMNCAQIGWQLTQLWNSRFLECFTTYCGSGTTYPAMLIEPAAVGDSLDGSQTLSFLGCQWESDTGTDVKILGTAASPSNNIQFVGCKWERQTASATYPVVDMDYAGRVYFTGFDMGAGGTSTTSRLVEIGANMAADGHVGFANGRMGHPQNQPDYYIILGSGLLTMASCYLVDAPTSKYIQVASGVGLEAVFLAANTFAAAGSIMEDNRSGGTGPDDVAPANYMGLIGTAAFGSVGIFGTVDLPDSVTSGVQYACRPSTRFRSVQSYRVRITYTVTGGGGNIRWQVKALATGTGTDLTSGAGTATSTDAAPTANLQKFVELTPVAAVNPGAMIGFQIERLGGDALDTNTGTVQIVSVDLVGQKRQ